jgi:hypothetical protein
LTNFVYDLGDPAITEAFGAYVDQPQIDYSNPVCGPTAYAIVDASYTQVDASKIGFSGNSIVLYQTTDLSEVTNADVQYYLKVYLPDYEVSSPSTAILYEPFLVNIKNCLIDSFTTDSDSSNSYNVYAGKIYIAYSPFVEVPNAASLPLGDTVCGYALTYTAKWRTYYDTLIDLPYFIVWNKLFTRFEIFSEDEADLTTNYLTYDIELTVTTSTADQNPAATHT